MNCKTGTVETDSFELDYFCFGTGEKIAVIIPGMSVKPIFPAAEFVAKRYERYTSEYTFYLFERRKKLDSSSAAVFVMANDTAVAMKSLGIKDAYIIGISQGGMMAEYMAVYFPELVKKLTVSSSIAKPNKVSRAVFSGWEKLSQDKDAAGLNKSLNETIYSKEYYLANKAAFDSPANYGTDSELEHFAYLSAASKDFDILSEIGKIKCPFFVIGCENDAVMTAEASVLMAEKSNCELYIYDGYSHAVYDEADDFVDRVFEFFNR